MILIKNIVFTKIKKKYVNRNIFIFSLLIIILKNLSNLDIIFFIFNNSLVPRSESSSIQTTLLN
jgi:hypothetical protein